MRTPEEIDQEIDALFDVAKTKREKVNSEDAKKELDNCLHEIDKLKNFWEQEKEEQQHLMEETRQNYEADIFNLVERVKNAD
ncbi:MAG: hypothetical protein ACNS60_07860 [Candidatus Cyclobacteriaceae bacterium M2_1C_046]